MVKKIINNSLEEDIRIAAIDKTTARRYRIDNKLDHGARFPYILWIRLKLQTCPLPTVFVSKGPLQIRPMYKKAVLNSEENIILIASGDLSHNCQ